MSAQATGQRMPEPGTGMWDLNFKHLQAFLAVADTLSFTSAADQLGSNQPTLTRSVRRLEEQLGVPLFLRTTRQVSLSPDGARLRDRLRELLPHLSQALFPEPERPVLRLGFAWLLPDGWVQEAIRRFEKETGAQVELRRRDDRWAGVDQAAVDVALLRGRPPADRMKVTALGAEECAAAVPQGHPLDGRSWVSWAELADHPLVVNSMSGAIQDADWSADAPPAGTVRCHNFDECLESVAAGRGVSVMPDLVLRRNLHPAVAFVPLREAPSIPLSLIRPVQGAHPLAERFALVTRKVLLTRRSRAAGRVRARP
ncbi:LysR family transcriptional regulator [Streptomyces sp. NL15-2K]|uniref:LysR family transcriptional regulator n=1 Tax=Streptomyces sp. NL15-2K TaxID=376149 RepID=UPI00155A9F4B|nr:MULTISPECIES: LysR family transcriptional regulator [Actinomycetes]WKX07870.1 LysR family transcriptional regulator [Kutzneria buriramensis]